MLQTAILIAGMMLGQATPQRLCTTKQTYPLQAQAIGYVQQPYVAPTYNKDYVEKVLFLPVERDDPYYATLIHDKLRQENREREKVAGEQDLATQVAKLTESLNKLEVRFGQLIGAPSPVPGASPVPQRPTIEPTEPTPTPKPEPPASNPDVVKLKQNVSAILTNNCKKCHTGDTSAKQFVMFDENEKLLEFTPLQKVLIDHEVYSGKMPKSSKPLTEAEYSAVRAWVDLDREDIVKALKKG
jgi:hypothetical protein